MRQLLPLLSVLLIACGSQSGGEHGSADANTSSQAKVTLSTTTAQLQQGQILQLSWQSQAVDRCVASGAWSGEQAVSGQWQQRMDVVGTFNFLLRCSQSLTGTQVEDALSVSVSAPQPTDAYSGSDGDDADALFRHYHQYTQ